MKKSGGSSFLGTYIMYGLVAIAFFLLVIFMVRGSLVEHYSDGSQWKRINKKKWADSTAGSNNYSNQEKSVTYTSAPNLKGTDDQLLYNVTFTKYRIKDSEGTYSIKDYLNKIQANLDNFKKDFTKKGLCPILGQQMQKANFAINPTKTEVEKLKDKNIKTKKDKDLYTRSATYVNKLITKYNNLLRELKPISNNYCDATRFQSWNEITTIQI